MFTAKRFVPVFVAAAVIAGCTPKPASVNVEPAAVSLSEAGKSAPLSAAVLDKDGKAIEKSPVVWSSSNPAVATVADGTVTAVKSGKATVTATAGTASGSAEVTVSIPAKIEVNPAEVAVQVAAPAAEGAAPAEAPAVPATATIAATVKDDADQPVAGAKVEFVSANPAVATVDAAGVVTAVAAGETTVDAKLGALTASVKVTVTAPPPPPAPAKGKGKKK